MASISFTVPGIPIAKARARIGGKRPNGKLGMFTPSPTKVYEALVKRLAIKAMEGREFLDGPLYVQLKIYRPIQKNRSKEFTANAENIWHCVKPDGDNIVKAVFDGMNKAIYQDDARIACGFYAKSYSERPRVEITIMELSQWQPKKIKKNGPQTMWSVGQLIPSFPTPATVALTPQSKLLNLLHQ